MGRSEKRTQVVLNWGFWVRVLPTQAQAPLPWGSCEDQNQIITVSLEANIITNYYNMAANLRFLFQDTPLIPTSSHVSNHLYLEARTKVTRQKDLAEATRLQAMLRGIQDLEQTQKCRISYQSKVMMGPRKVPDFYEYNQSWQNSILKKNEDSRRSQRQQKQHQKIQQRERGKENKSSDLTASSTSHCGPISAWNHHFQNYIRVRTDASQEKEMFKPKLNRNSQKIIQKKYEGHMKQKVEERLIKQAEEKRLKNFSTIKNETGPVVTLKGNPEIFQRLYSEAGEQAKRKEQKREMSTCSFEPKINKNTPYDSVIEQKRRPLYIPPDITQNSVVSEDIKVEKEFSEELFSDFLQRNEALLSKRKSTQLQIRKETQQQVMKECTFNPTLNQRSIAMALNSKHNYSSQSYLRECSVDSIEQVSVKQRTVVVPLIPPIDRHLFEAEVLKTQESTRRRELQPIVNSVKVEEETVFAVKIKVNNSNLTVKEEIPGHSPPKWSDSLKRSSASGNKHSPLPSKEQMCDQSLHKHQEQQGNQESQEPQEQFEDQFEEIQRQLEQMIKGSG